MKHRTSLLSLQYGHHYFGGLWFGPIKGIFFFYNIIRQILFCPYVGVTVKVRPRVRYLDLVIWRQYKRTNALIRLYYYDMTTSWDVIITGLLYSFYNRLNFNYTGHRLFRFISVVFRSDNEALKINLNVF